LNLLQHGTPVSQIKKVFLLLFLQKKKRLLASTCLLREHKVLRNFVHCGAVKKPGTLYIVVR